MPKFEFTCLVFLIFVKFSSQYDCELCYDGRIDALFSYENKLIVFKGDSVYSYGIQEIDDAPRKPRLDINRVDSSVYGKLLDNKTIELVFQFKIPLSEFCSNGSSDLQFDHIQTAFYDERKQKVILIGGK